MKSIYSLTVKVLRASRLRILLLPVLFNVVKVLPQSMRIKIGSIIFLFKLLLTYLVLNLWGNTYAYFLSC